MTPESESNAFSTSLPKTAYNAFQGWVPVWTLSAAEREVYIHMKNETGWLKR